MLDHVCDTEFATNMTFKVVTSILNFYIPTACIIVLYVRIFLVIKRRSKDIDGLVGARISKNSDNQVVARAGSSTANLNENTNTLSGSHRRKEMSERSYDDSLTDADVDVDDRTEGHKRCRRHTRSTR